METDVSFKVEGENVRGVLHEPDRANGVGVIFLHGWPGNRIGPHRMFVTLARRLASQGVSSLRIDCRGRGESEGQTEAATIRSMMADTSASIGWLSARPGIRAVYLLGICSGGKVAVGAAAGDSRVRGLMLWSAEAMGYLRHKAARRHKALESLRAYLKKLGSLETWRKILAGRVNTRLVRKAIVTDEAPREAELAHESAVLDQFRSFRGPLLFVYGGNDPDTRFAADAYSAFCRRHGVSAEFHDIPEANHSFYSLRWEAEVLEWTERWLSRQADAAGR